jgi:hypothetical protein
MLPHPSNPHNAILFLRLVCRPQTSVTGRKARKTSINAWQVAPYVENVLCTAGSQHFVRLLASLLHSAAGSSHCTNVNTIMRMVLMTVHTVATYKLHRRHTEVRLSNRSMRNATATFADPRQKMASGWAIQFNLRTYSACAGSWARYAMCRVPPSKQRMLIMIVNGRKTICFRSVRCL